MIDKIYTPEDDGVTHINIYSKGKTEVGRLLSNFAYTPFVHPIDGHFNSVEGYWYWLKTGMKYDDLRELTGFLAKRFGQDKECVPAAFFEQYVIMAIEAKIYQNEDVKSLLRESTLPFIHCYRTRDDRSYIALPKYQWIVDFITKMREALRGG